MRKRTVAALICLAVVAGVLIYQAATAEPPEPYVELYNPRPEAPVAVYSCDNGRQMVDYTTGEGEHIIAPTGARC